MLKVDLPATYDCSCTGAYTTIEGTSDDPVTVLVAPITLSLCSGVTWTLGLWRSQSTIIFIDSTIGAGLSYRYRLDTTIGTRVESPSLPGNKSNYKQFVSVILVARSTLCWRQCVPVCANGMCHKLWRASNATRMALKIEAVCIFTRPFKSRIHPHCRHFRKKTVVTVA